MSKLLEIRGLEASYGMGKVLSGIDFSIEDGQVATLLGRNGMGKSTLIRSIFGLTHRLGGTIKFEGKEIQGLKADRVGRLGIALVPEGRQIFGNLSVKENLIAFSARRNGGSQPWTLDRVFSYFPSLAARSRNMGNQLSGGEQQMLAIGRALMTNPRLLILDEATEGLAPLIREEIWKCVAALRQAGQTIIIVDKYVERLMVLADEHSIIERGEVAWKGNSVELGADQSLWQKYLGV